MGSGKSLDEFRKWDFERAMAHYLSEENYRIASGFAVYAMEKGFDVDKDIVERVYERYSEKLYGNEEYGRAERLETVFDKYL